MLLSALIRPEWIFGRLAAQDSDAILRELAERASAAGISQDAEGLYRRLAEREELSSTGLGQGVAVPHCKIDGLESPVLGFGIADSPGIEFGSPDGQPVRIFFLIVSPTSAPAAHLKALAAISHWIKGEQVQAALARGDADKVLRLLETDESEEL